MQRRKDPLKLAELRHGNCRKTEEEISKALHTNGREDYLFALNQELEMYEVLQSKIVQCDVEIEKILNSTIGKDDNKRQHHIEPKKHKKLIKHS
ncbi:hypothetical protein [Kaistella flava (ex Peng et al. 2021)]|uniref:hypothetical protein n=1 Tax=Kaistella flava (ex Peng et al. 2021) TaxID=2038776 RepID=UPI001FC7C27F|nr:hypothetical protein [Kaistella flava (ex Peng et al. 2021)]